MMNSFFFLFGVYRVLEKSSSNTAINALFIIYKHLYYKGDLKADDYLTNINNK